MLGSRIADLVQSCPHVPQGAPSFRIHIQALAARMYVAAVLFFGKEPVFTAAILVETNDLSLPLLHKLLPNRRIASLPIITANVVDLETSLVKFQPLPREIEQWPHQSLHV